MTENIFDRCLGVILSATGKQQKMSEKTEESSTKMSMKRPPAGQNGKMEPGIVRN